MPLLIAYGLGLVGTAAFLLRDQADMKDLKWNAGFIILWPAYWAYVAGFHILNRKGKG